MADREQHAAGPEPLERTNSGREWLRPDLQRPDVGVTEATGSSSAEPPQPAAPRLELRRAADLGSLPLEPAERTRDAAAAAAFNVRAPRRYLELIDWADERDPIRRQVIPSADELVHDPREREDPIGDAAHSPVARLTHRYPDRVLLYPTYQCAVYCRHCFRKESLADDDAASYSIDRLAPALAYIAEHPEIREVILTGGDPLILANERLEELRRRIEAIDHVRMLRLHTRIPVVLPERVGPGLADALKGRLMVCVVTHFNHAREITPATIAAARTLREAGFMLLNQTVLLKGVNDDAEALRTLFRELVYALGIRPYYLHHCDSTRGLSHFRTTIDRGLELMAALRGHISGLCVPHYVLDLPGGDGKIPLGPSYVAARSGFEWQFKTYDARSCNYSEIVSENPSRDR
ncbi:KamA family radical SAM protein [Nannocystis radixulma]|uniref:KamA family radical SAM protein n=1 Tax=Nannocystis radixulma TaxID=2995305 RepID=A0ABT5BD01_9BACT|nr:KamA family radical SAM protein [Nannocystis radixulma]MDC0671598.1 KamA family radical SAM protein [Nannocystis radixulma]